MFDLDELGAQLSALINLPATERFREFAVRRGIDKRDPMLEHAVEALSRFKKGEVTAGEADAALEPLFEALNKKARETPMGVVAIPANSFREAPLREYAKEAGVAESDPLLLRALKAQEKADWRTSWQSWQEMEIAVWAFMLSNFEFKSAWPPKSGQIDVLLHKLEQGSATAAEIGEFRRLGNQVLRDWQPEYSPAFKNRIESAMSKLDAGTGENVDGK